MTVFNISEICHLIEQGNKKELADALRKCETLDKYEIEALADYIDPDKGRKPKPFNFKLASNMIQAKILYRMRRKEGKSAVSAIFELMRNFNKSEDAIRKWLFGKPKFINNRNK